MSDTIDLDEEFESEEPEPEPDGNYGDWLWKGGDPDDEPKPSYVGWPDDDAPGDDTLDHDAPDEAATTSSTAAANATTTDAADTADADGTEATDTADTTETADTQSDDTAPDTPSSGDGERTAMPGIPRESSGPVGVPQSQGGAGGGVVNDSPSATPDAAGAAGGTEADAGDEGRSRRTTNHGGDPDPDDMTMAFTYEAVNRLADPAFAVADARGWSDWIGIVGKVSTPAIRKFQRDEGVDLDFFGGNESGPAERLKDITEDSMFYADRMVVVGTSSDEWIAEEAGWEFVPLADAAEGAGWEIEYEE